MSDYKVPTSSILHAGYSTPLTAAWQSAPPVTAADLIFPIFIVEDRGAKQEISSMPGQYRYGVDRLVEALEGPVKDGLQAVLLFGVLDGAVGKDGIGSAADTADAPVVLACQLLRKAFPKLLIITDLCLCGYTDHGHCGILKEDRTLDNDASVARLASVAVAYARAGAHMIAPSDMMDGRIGAIKAALRAAGFGSSVPVMSYAAKFASCFYGPFRDAAHSGMSFGDRSKYQLPPGSRDLALRAVERDVAEGADFVMVKPGMPYLDIVRDTADRVHVPVAVYQVSGEFAMLYHAAAAGGIDLRRGVMESLQAFKRAGARLIITYFAPTVLQWLKE